MTSATRVAIRHPMVIYIIGLALVASVILCSQVIFGLHVALSVFAGLLLGAVNFFLLHFFITRLVRGRHKVVIAILLVGKIMVILALLWLCLAYLKLNTIGLLSGLTLPLIAVIYAGFKHKRSSV